MFPPGHFILLPEPSAVRSPCRRRWISLPPMTFLASSSLAGNLRFRGARGRSTHRRKTIWKTAPHAPLFSGSLPSTCRRVWAHGSLSGDETSYLGLFGAVLLLHPSGGLPRVHLIRLFAHFSSAALRQSLFSTVWVTFLHLQFHNHDSQSY